MATGTPQPGPPPAQMLVPGLRWRRVFPGKERQLGLLRRWLAELLPPCEARDDVATVATELGSNAIRHTASGQAGGWFAVEITWHPQAVLIAVADCGGPAEPHAIDDPAGERGRGLFLVRGLSLRYGFTGDQRGRLVWAQVAWDDPNPPAQASADDPYQAAVREGETALARRFIGVPAWFGRSTLAWWAIAGPRGLVSAPSARELAALLHRLLQEPGLPPPRARSVARTRHGRASEPARSVEASRNAPARKGLRPGVAGISADRLAVLSAQGHRTAFLTEA